MREVHVRMLKTRGREREGSYPAGGETVGDRARRYLTDGRLTVHRADGTQVLASCAGHHAQYRLGYDQDHGWWCECGSRDTCSHLYALGLVVDIRSLV